MPICIVQSKQNGRLKELRSALAAPSRGQGELIGIEGPNLVAEALRTGLRLRCIFVSEGEQRLIEGLDLPSETEVLVAPRDVLQSVLTTESPQPVAALVYPPQWTWEHILPPLHHVAPLVVVLAGLQDPGNLGTILRSAEAFGATAILCLPGTVSPWNPKAVRASAGSVFRVPVVASNTTDAFTRLRASGVAILVAAARAASPADHVLLAHPTALLIGNEGNGVPADVAELADGAITIPCPGPVESLNAAVAASVLLYEASRQRSAGGANPQEGTR
jgi:TrmH family RNA methyltransferase